MLHVKQCKWPKLFFFFSSPPLEWVILKSSPGKNAGDFHILTAICSFLSKAHQVFLTHRKHIEIDCVCFCVYPCVRVCVCVLFLPQCFLSSGFFIFDPSFFNGILSLSCTFALCCHNDNLRVLQEEEYILVFHSQVKHICNANCSFYHLL